MLQQRKPVARKSDAPSWPGSNGTSDPWYDGQGMDATEASLVFGFDSAFTGRAEFGPGSFVGYDGA